MEEHELLNRANKVDIYALQFVLVRRIKKSLNEFKEGWNHQQLSTEQNKSPYQICMLGMMESNKKNKGFYGCISNQLSIAMSSLELTFPVSPNHAVRQFFGDS